MASVLGQHLGGMGRPSEALSSTSEAFLPQENFSNNDGARGNRPVGGGGAGKNGQAKPPACTLN